MGLQLQEIRIKLDQHAERIVSGLKDRSRYPLNAGTFREKFFDGKTWFEYRMLKEQNLDSEFGRYEFEDQEPIFVSRAELEKPRVRRDSPRIGLLPTNLDNSSKLVSMYQKFLCLICKEGEDIGSYGETTKIDVNNVLALHERIFLGKEVAEVKLQSNPQLRYLEKESIRAQLINKQREQEVIDKSRAIAIRYELNPQDAIANLFRSIIESTLDLEETYILQARRIEESQPKNPIGGGQIPQSGNPKSGLGFGSQ